MSEAHQFKPGLRSTSFRKGNVKLPGVPDIGKLPPQALDLEEAVLGAIMLEKNAISEIIDILKPETFYADEHKEVYTAMIELFEKSKPIDLLTVTNELRQRGTLETVGGAYAITELTNRVSSAANIEYHARIIAEKYLLRELIRVSGQIQRDAFDETTDVFDLLDTTEQELFNITSGNIKSQYEPLNMLLKKAISQMEELALKTDGLSGVPSGFSNLDRITSGWQPSDLVILAARPGMGKTSFVLALARNAAVDFKMGVAVFSLEMSAVQLVHRLISSEAEIDGKKLRSGQLEQHEWQQLNTRIAKMADAPIYIDDSPGLNIFDLRAKCRRLKSLYNIQIIIIDYLQLMSGKSDNRGGNREQEISSISRALKALAKELNVPVIALSQLSREVEKRGGLKKPMLSDLRESGSIEQDADQVIFLYRGEYYGYTQDEEGNSIEGIGEVIIAKNRHGSTETVPIRFIGNYAKFVDLDEFAYSQPAELQPVAGTIVKGSKMNEEHDDEDAPF